MKIVKVAASREWRKFSPEEKNVYRLQARSGEDGSDDRTRNELGRFVRDPEVEPHIPEIVGAEQTPEKKHFKSKSSAVTFAETVARQLHFSLDADNTPEKLHARKLLTKATDTDDTLRRQLKKSGITFNRCENRLGRPVGTPKVADENMLLIMIEKTSFNFCLTKQFVLKVSIKMLCIRL